MTQTQDGTTIKQREIVLIEFPFTDFTQRKKRPALILSNSDHLAKQEDMLCCPLTSKEKDFDTAVKITDDDVDGYLKFESWALADKLMCIEQNEKDRTIGRLSLEKCKEIVKKTKKTIELED